MHRPLIGSVSFYPGNDQAGLYAPTSLKALRLLVPTFPGLAFAISTGTKHQIDVFLPCLLRFTQTRTTASSPLLVWEHYSSRTSSLG